MHPYTLAQFLLKRMGVGARNLLGHLSRAGGMTNAVIHYNKNVMEKRIQWLHTVGKKPTEV